VVEEAISTRTAAIISYHPPIFKPLTSFTLTNPLQKSLLLCAARGISVFSPHTALDSVKGGINDWLSDIVRSAAPGTVEYVGAPKEDDLGGEGRLVRFQQPVELDSFVNTIKKGLALTTGMCSLSDCRSMVAQSCHCPESSTWSLVPPTLRKCHVGSYMRWKWWFYVARRRRGCLFHGRDVPCPSTCPMIWRSRGSLHYFAARSTGGCGEWSACGVMWPYQHRTWIHVNVGRKAEG